MKLKYRFLKIAVCLIILVLMMNFSLKRYRDAQFSEFSMKIIDQNELGFINSENIKNTFFSHYQNPENIQIKDIHVTEIEKELQQNPYVDSLNIYLDQDQKLNVYVQQKHPKIRIDNQNKYYYLTENAQKIPISNQFSKKCLMVEGDIKEEEYASLLALERLISEDNLLKKHIVGVRKQANNSFILLVNTDAFFIEFGSLDDSAQKLTNLKAFYEQYLNHVGIDKYKKISVKYSNQIVATKK